jgi:flagellar hook-associated protein 2
MATISVNGLGSNLDIDGWISKLVSIKQAQIDATTAQKATVVASQTELSAVSSNFSTLLSSMQDLTDSNYGLSMDLFAKKSATSSTTSVANATAASSASIGNVSLIVSNLATSTVAQSGSSVASKVTGDTKISEIAGGAIDEGNFSIYLNNQKYSIAVTSDSKLSDVLSSIKSQTGLNATITDGKVSISSSTPSDSIVVGSNADTSDFANVLGIVKQTDGSYQSEKTNWLANQSKALTASDAGYTGTITAGTFKIGNYTATIDSSTTMNSLIQNINKNASSGVSASWDATNGKLVLTSTSTGATNINIEAGTSNFTDVMGLTSSGKIADNTQTLGTNAKVSINGNTLSSTSNSITSDISGISGLTINLTGTGSSSISIANDNSSLVSAVKSFVSSFNTTISTVDTDTASDGKLYGESSLSMIRDLLRSQVTSAYGSDSTYDSLATIGITTGDVGASVDSDTNKLYFDEDKFTKALQDNPDAVRKLLIGTTATSGDGALSALSKTVNGSFDSDYGYFNTRNASYNEQISDISDKITRQTDDLTAYKTRITAQFQAMDEIISNLKSSMTYLTNNGILSSTTSSSSSKS